MTAASMTPATPARPATDLRHVVAPYATPDARRAWWQVANTMVPLGALMWLSHVTRETSIVFPLLLAPLIAGFLVRTFIIMHDCAHGSFSASRRWNDIVGFITGVLTLTPFAQWRRDHALHHASSGDLDRRGHGDVPTLTVREYLARTPRARRMYRIIRHPLVLLFLGPVHLAIGQRFRARSTATGTPQIKSVALTNLGIVAAVALAIWLAGWTTTLLAYVLPYYIAAMAGVWLFYVQHQFEDAYWERGENWDYVESALRGSSHLQLPRPLAWFTGDIGLHHVHHVAPRIPNHRLRECHRDNPVFHQSPTVTLRSGMAAFRLALWDEDRGRLVGFRDVDGAQRSAPPDAAAAPQSALS